MRIAIATFATLGVLAVATPGLCEEAPRPSPAISTLSTWYGYQTLLADGASFATILLSMKADGARTWDIVALSFYAVAAPTIHAVHRRWGVAGLDFVMRTTLSLGGFWLGYKAAGNGSGCDDPNMCKLGFGVIGMTLGVLTATTVDAVFLAWQPPSVTQPSPPQPPRQASTHSLISLWSFGIAPSPNGASLTLGGQF